MHDLIVVEWEDGADMVKGLKLWERMGWWEKRRMRKVWKEADKMFEKMDKQMNSFCRLVSDCNGTGGGGWCVDCRNLVVGLVAEKTDDRENSTAESSEVLGRIITRTI